ncbi:MAG: hypothetical protein H0X51_09325 [Parachlamydiaceae bacterium]|nr:hypothetical protein [Parachlamydiaceae bacterium]
MNKTSLVLRRHGARLTYQREARTYSVLLEAASNYRNPNILRTLIGHVTQPEDYQESNAPISNPDPYYPFTLNVCDSLITSSATNRIYTDTTYFNALKHLLTTEEPPTTNTIAETCTWLRTILIPAHARGDDLGNYRTVALRAGHNMKYRICLSDTNLSVILNRLESVQTKIPKFQREIHVFAGKHLKQIDCQILSEKSKQSKDSSAKIHVPNFPLGIWGEVASFALPHFTPDELQHLCT